MIKKSTTLLLLLILTKLAFGQNLETKYQEVYRNDSVHTPIQLYIEDNIRFTTFYNNYNKCVETLGIEKKISSNKDTINRNSQIQINQLTKEVTISKEETKAARKVTKTVIGLFIITQILSTVVNIIK